jgi:predicted RNA binding protein YcfA (HicA-like mRNA interferase family)
VSLKPIKALDLIKLLSKVGFLPVRQRGSHVILKHEDGRVTVIPVHSGEELGRGLLLWILSDVGLSREDYLRLLGS